MRTDRMGALGRSQGKRFQLHPPALEFARHHGIEITTCQAGDAKRKGKIERPFRPLKEAFLEELDVLGPPADLDELNVRAQQWLARRVWPVAHRTTGEPPIARLAIEQPFLKPLPRARFDTAYVEPRRVHVALPLIEWRGVRYSVPPACLGQRVEVRQERRPTIALWCAGPARSSRPIGSRRPAHVRCGIPNIAETPNMVRSHATPEHICGSWTAPRRTKSLRTHLSNCESRSAAPITTSRSSISAATHPPTTGLSHDRDNWWRLYEQLKDDLGYLQLGRAAEVFATLAEQARRDKLSHVEFLARLVAEQTDATKNRRLAARLRFAKFPFRRTIDDFDFEFQPSIDRKLVDDLATLRFITDARPILFLGQPGCGKTHLAVALAVLAVEAGYRGYFTSADDMVRNLAHAMVDGTFASKLRTYTAPTVLVIDDVGLLPIEAGRIDCMMAK